MSFMRLNAAGLDDRALPEPISPAQPIGLLSEVIGCEPPDEWISVAEAAKLCGLASDTVREASREGLLRRRIVARRVQVPRADLFRWRETLMPRRRGKGRSGSRWERVRAEDQPQPAVVRFLNREIVRLRNLYAEEVGFGAMRGSGHLIAAEMLLDERARLLRRPNAGLEAELDSLGASGRFDVA